MPQFRLEAHKAVRHDLKKIPPQAVREIVNKVFLKIVQNPFVGISLVGPLRGYFKFVFHFGGVSYRIIYQVHPQQKLVFIVAVGPRGKFYERLLKRIE
jgi:mRNA-degrading endonuclease RelE of RelBE toxin-antitoxin system